MTGCILERRNPFSLFAAIIIMLKMQHPVMRGIRIKKLPPERMRRS
ncbi:hypothetical protein KIS4809_2976 [Bacillus sp. ZZV12-4809]|nr:hypothetical protein KIS4809_2976 [Bacillus sp. ZZV12-4809]